ncbi:integrator complex subunit 5-like, partial [Exaiptasia diaphana]
MDTLVTLCRSDTAEESHIITSNTDQVALLLMEMVCPEMVLYTGEWPDEETLKFNVERDLRIRNTFDRNPVLWWLLLLVSQGASSLCKCAPLLSSLLATVMSSWEVCRDKMVTQSSELFRDTQYIMQVMVESDWLPAPLSRIGGVLHLLSPKEIFAVINTMWKVLK